MSNHTTIRNVYLDYNAISLRAESLATEIKSANFEGLVIILRGGSFAGIHLAFITGLPYYFLRYDRLTTTPEWVGNLPTEKRLLLCEDFAGMGQTLINSKKFLTDQGYDVSTFVVCKDRLSASVPDYYCFDLQESNARFVLPWERYRLNSEAVNASVTNRKLDHEYERTAWDMDGVFLDDIESHHYHNDLEATLSLRDQYPLADYAPTPGLHDMIITGRPIIDKERTEEWLRKHGIEIPVVFRDNGIEFPTAESVARWKGQRAIELGFTHYVESDSDQALFMASCYPELRVIWWNKGNPIHLNAFFQKSAKRVPL